MHIDHDQFIVYVDESGDANFQNIDPRFPFFVLVFCVFSQKNYLQQTLPSIEALKFRYFGHDAIVLHEHDLYRGTQVLRDKQDRQLYNRFMMDLSKIIAFSSFHVIAAAVDKRFFARSEYHLDPYVLAFKRCLLDLECLLVDELRVSEFDVPIVAESRGVKADAKLARECETFCVSSSLNASLMFAKKNLNCCGLQIADLVARPIARSLMNPLQPNRAFDVLQSKIFRSRVLAGEDTALKLDIYGKVA